MSNRWVSVPNALCDQINSVLDEVLSGAADDVCAERHYYYASLLAHFDEHGRVPAASEIQITKCQKADGG